mgnify:CR=1 FL=1
MNTSKKYPKWPLAAAFILQAFTPSGKAQSVWDGGGADNNWTTPENWDLGSAPVSGDTTAIQLDGTTNTAINVDTLFTFNTLTVNSGGGPFSLSGSDLTLHGSGSVDGGYTIRNNSANLLAVDNNLILTGDSGISAVNGDITLGGNIIYGDNSYRLRLLADSGSTLTVNGVISGTGRDLAFNNGGTIILNAANTYSATANIWNATVIANTDTAFSSSEVRLGANNAGTYEATLLTGQDVTISNRIRLVTNSTGTNSITIGGEHTSGTSEISSYITLGAGDGENLNLTAASGGRMNITGSLRRDSGATGSSDTVTKVGTGIVAIENSYNDYHGTTTVASGTLLVNGTISTLAGETAAFTVNSGATLGGTGAIGRNVNLLSGSFIEVGDNDAGLTGTLNIIGDLDLADASTLKFDLGTNSDQLMVDGDIMFNGSVSFDLNQQTGFGDSVSYTFLSTTGTISGNTAGISLVGGSIAGYTLQVDGSSISLVAASAIPEPSAATLLFGGLAFCGVLGLKRPSRSLMA